MDSNVLSLIFDLLGDDNDIMFIILGIIDLFVGSIVILFVIDVFGNM